MGDRGRRQKTEDRRQEAETGGPRAKKKRKARKRESGNQQDGEDCPRKTNYTKYAKKAGFYRRRRRERRPVQGFLGWQAEGGRGVVGNPSRRRTSKSFRAARVWSSGTSGRGLASWTACNSPRRRWLGLEEREKTPWSHEFTGFQATGNKLVANVFLKLKGDGFWAARHPALSGGRTAGSSSASNVRSLNTSRVSRSITSSGRSPFLPPVPLKTHLDDQSRPEDIPFLTFCHQFGGGLVTEPAIIIRKEAPGSRKKLHKRNRSGPKTRSATMGIFAG